MGEIFDLTKHPAHATCLVRLAKKRTARAGSFSDLARLLRDFRSWTALSSDQLAELEAEVEARQSALDDESFAARQRAIAEALSEVAREDAIRGDMG